MKEKKYKSLGVAVLIPLIFVIPLYHFFGAKFAENYGRFANWEKMMRFWDDNLSHTFGSGPGTYWVYVQAVEGIKDKDKIWLRMHNDWFQILFEQGWVGLISIIYLFISMLKRSFHEPVIFSMVLGFGLIACTMYPLHLFFFQLIGMALIYHCFAKEESIEGAEVEIELNS